MTGLRLSLPVQMQRLRLEQRQGEPKFEKVKRRLEESKASQRGLDGSSFRSSADMDRHRQLAADSAIERQLEAQSAFRSQGTYLQSVVNRASNKELELRKLCVLAFVFCVCVNSKRVAARRASVCLLQMRSVE
jgi:hypothetical protein